MRILRRIRSYFTLSLRLYGVRSDTLDKELIKELKKAGTYFVGVGIESVSEEVRRLNRKRVNLSHVRDVVR